MESVEDYARQWAKREKEDLDTLSEWVRCVRSLIQIRMKKGSGSLGSVISFLENRKMFIITACQLLSRYALIMYYSLMLLLWILNWQP